MPPLRTIVDERFVLALGPAPAMTFVDGVRAGDDVAGVLDAVRGHVRRADRASAEWAVTRFSEPADLAERLSALGLVPSTTPPFEPSATALVLDAPPPSSSLPDGITVRRAETDAELREGYDLLARAEEIAEDRRREWIEPLVSAFDRSTTSMFVADLDGVPCAAGVARLTELGSWLAGAATLPSARGRGAYRALVAARWDEAVARGRAVLTTQAGSMSCPVLVRLGFRAVGEIRYLHDTLR